MGRFYPAAEKSWSDLIGLPRNALCPCGSDRKIKDCHGETSGGENEKADTFAGLVAGGSDGANAGISNTGTKA